MKRRWLVALALSLSVGGCSYWYDFGLSPEAQACIESGGKLRTNYCEHEESNNPAEREQARQCREVCGSAPNNESADRFCRLHCQG